MFFDARHTRQIFVFYRNENEKLKIIHEWSVSTACFKAKFSMEHASFEGWCKAMNALCPLI